MSLFLSFNKNKDKKGKQRAQGIRGLQRLEVCSRVRKKNNNRNLNYPLLFITALYSCLQPPYQGPAEGASLRKEGAGSPRVQKLKLLKFLSLACSLGLPYFYSLKNKNGWGGAFAIGLGGTVVRNIRKSSEFGGDDALIVKIPRASLEEMVKGSTDGGDLLKKTARKIADFDSSTTKASTSNEAGVVHQEVVPVPVLM